MKRQTGISKMATGVLEKPNPPPHTWSSAAVLPPNASSGSSAPSLPWHRTRSILLTPKCGLWIKNIHMLRSLRLPMWLRCSPGKHHMGKTRQSRPRRDLKCTTRGLGLVKSVDCQYEICAGNKMSTLDTLLDSSSLLRVYSSSTQ